MVENVKVTRPTMADVAVAAGVSTQTVSRALTGHLNVRPETRERVKAAAAALKYRYNATAKAFASGRTGTLGLIVQPTTSYSAAALTYAVERAAQASGYALSIATTSPAEGPSMADTLTELINRAVDGVILAVPINDGSAPEPHTIESVPIVMLDGVGPPNASSVMVDQASIGRLATQHLLDVGHETVWAIAGHESWTEAASRLQGWRDALSEAGRPIPEPVVGDWSPQSGYDLGAELAANPDVTAIFVASDEMALGAMRALNEAGRAVPQDVSIVGVDDISLAAFASPPLTTVRQPWQEIGSRAVAQLLDPQPGERQVLQPELVVRSSTAAPRAAGS